MDVKLHLSGTNASQLTEHLKEELFNSDLDQLEEVYRLSDPPKEGELGHTWLDILNVAIAGSGFLLALAGFVRGWLQDRQEDIEISLEVDGKTISISGKDEAEIMQKLKALEDKLQAEE